LVLQTSAGLDEEEIKKAERPFFISMPNNLKKTERRPDMNVSGHHEQNYICEMVSRGLNLD